MVLTTGLGASMPLPYYKISENIYCSMSFEKPRIRHPIPTLVNMDNEWAQAGAPLSCVSASLGIRLGRRLNGSRI